MSTPTQLHEFEDPFVSDVKYYNIDEQFDYDNDDELFIGSDLSTGNFFRCFDFFNDRHKLSKSARDDLLNLFSTTLPRANTIKTNNYVQLIPNIVASEGESSSIVMIDLLLQLSKIVQRNSKNILKSWSSNCSCDMPATSYCLSM